MFHKRAVTTAMFFSLTALAHAQTAPAPETPAPATQPAPMTEQTPRAEAPKVDAKAEKKSQKAGTKPVKVRETALSADPTPSLTADTYQATMEAAQRYAAIAEAGGWPQVPSDVKDDTRGEAVRALRERLALEGDLARDAQDGDIVDDALIDAVKSFQLRMGLQPTGIAAGATLAALNVSAADRARALSASAKRIEGLKFDFGGRHVVVNIPAAAVEAVENGQVARRYVAVVGDKDHQSPQVTARIQSVTVNPTWTVPASIVRNEILPKLEKNPGYLKHAKMSLTDGKGREINPARADLSSDKAGSYLLRQEPGAKNSLGRFRINMPNKEAVYLHDTPAKSDFSEDYRFLSHGCVRVQHVDELAAWLLEGASENVDAASLAKDVAKKKTRDIKLRQAVPVTWVYMTGYASADGAVNFRNDGYELDASQAM